MFTEDRLKVFPTRVLIRLFFSTLNVAPFDHFFVSNSGGAHWCNHSNNLLSLLAGCGEVRAVACGTASSGILVSEG
jgi:hypothetical protein